MYNVSLVCGIDEAGRGPLAGPVYAAAVILGNDFPRHTLNDSKKLPEKTRDILRERICNTAIAWGIGSASHIEIDEINILQASLLAMKRAFENMEEKHPFLFNEKIGVIIDGIHIPQINAPCEAIVKADSSIPEVMAASILAKTARDSFMYDMAKKYPEYGYDKHKGYPTKEHRKVIFALGPSPIQRRSFKVKPV